MKIDRIYIEDIELISLLDFSYKKEVNEHAEAIICGLISDNNYDEYLSKSLTDDWVAVMGVEENGHSVCLFKGYIKDMSLMQINGQTAIKVAMVSGSYLADLVKYTVTYQDCCEKYSTILESISSKYTESFFRFSTKANASIGKMLVQYDETDWEFIKRIASELKVIVIPYASHEFVVLDFDLQEDYYVESVGEILESTEKCSQGYSSYIIKTREYFDIGQKVKYNNKELYVYSAKGEYVKQLLENVYELRMSHDFTQKTYRNDKLIGASLEAEVIGVSKDKVEIKVKGESGEKKKWFPYATIYSSPDGTGWYCMPEVGDGVRLYFPSNNENDGYVISSMHLPVSQEDEGSDAEQPRTKPECKSIKNKDGKEILFTPNSIVVTNNKGMKISLDDEVGISLISDKKISIESLDKIDIISVNQGVNIIASDEINMVQNESSINISGDVVISGGRIKTV